VDECKPLMNEQRETYREQVQSVTADGIDPDNIGKAVQVDPIKPTLKASGTKRLTLKSDEPLSNVALKFKLRRYTSASRWPSCTSLR